MKTKNKPSQVKDLIKEKFTTVARFCRIVGMDYKKVSLILRGNDIQAKTDLYIQATNTEDMSLPGELTMDQKNKIRESIRWMGVGDGKMKTFCKRYKVNATWLSRLLSTADYGACRTNSPNLKRLLKILNLEL